MVQGEQGRVCVCSCGHASWVRRVFCTRGHGRHGGRCDVGLGRPVDLRRDHLQGRVRPGRHAQGVCPCEEQRACQSQRSGRRENPRRELHDRRVRRRRDDERGEVVREAGRQPDGLLRDRQDRDRRSPDRNRDVRRRPALPRHARLRESRGRRRESILEDGPGWGAEALLLPRPERDRADEVRACRGRHERVFDARSRGRGVLPARARLGRGRNDAGREVVRRGRRPDQGILRRERGRGRGA